MIRNGRNWRKDAGASIRAPTNPYTIPCEEDLFRVHLQSTTHRVARPVVLTEGWRPLFFIRSAEKPIIAMVCPGLDVWGESRRVPAGKVYEVGRRRGAESDGKNRLFRVAIGRGIWSYVLSGILPKGNGELCILPQGSPVSASRISTS